MSDLRFRSLPLCALALATALFTAACSGVYYDVRERLGSPKRDILVNRVSAAREDQQEAEEQFESALDQFITLLNVEGGELEETYRALEGEYEESEAKAKALSDRIDSIESVAEALFAEWEDELALYQSDDLRRDSERQLRETRERYGELMVAMRRVESTMEPVLLTFRDHVLFLKHNLNARAIASLEGDLSSLESDVADLIAEMRESIIKADEFLREMEEMD